VKNIIEVINVSKAYRINKSTKYSFTSKIKNIFFAKKKDKYENFWALKNLNLYIEKGQATGIIGNNGAGKSTLLQIISGISCPTNGSVKVKGKITALLELGSGFNPHFTGIENIKLYATLHGLNKSKIKKKIQNIINFADIGDYINRPVKTYSSGMRLRLAFAVIAHIDSDVIIIDEALAVGDAHFKIKCFNFITEFKDNGGTLIIVSHDLNTLASICDNIIIINNGSIYKMGKPNYVINEYSKLITCNNNLENKKYSKNNYESSFSYGNDKARITNIKVIDHLRNENNILQSGEIFSIIFEVISTEIIIQPIYAITIKDLKGQKVYSTNTKFSKKKTFDLKKDSKVKIIFDNYCNLNKGEYSVSIGLTKYVNDEFVVIHRVYDAIVIKVVNLDGSSGLTNCFSKITIKAK